MVEEVVVEGGQAGNKDSDFNLVKNLCLRPKLSESDPDSLLFESC